MHQRLKRWLAAVVLPVIVALLGITVAVPARADGTDPLYCFGYDCTAKQATVSYALSHYPGVSIPPSRWTGWGRLTLTGFTKNGDEYVPTYKFDHEPPVRQQRHAAPLRRSSCPWWQNFCFDGHPVWYRPSSWAWGHIFGAAWGDVIDPCANGIAKGDITMMQGVWVAKMVAYFNVLERFGTSLSIETLDAAVSPTGFAISTISGCVAGWLARG